MARDGNGAETVVVGPNEVLRFLLEIAALFALGYAGWNLVDDALVSVVLATVLPLLGATVWGVFRVDGDPKVALVPVPGVVRLCIEVDVFTSAVVLLAVVGQAVAAGILAALVVGHYAWGHRRVRWLVRHPGRLPEMRGG
ncbi:MAG: DUF2568 domain-containing protein [Chloroflexi bacterium]|nr:DUF2568 domain-containing protein [Chloroflexota bacterium]